MRFLVTVLVAFSALFHCGTGLAAVPTCLPEKDAKKIEKTKSIEARLELYARIGKRQAERAVRHAGTYKPWSQTGSSSGIYRFPDALPPRPGSGSIEQILDSHDCAWKQLVKEVQGWTPRPPDWKSELTKISRLSNEAQHSLREARLHADPFPELQPRIEASLRLLEEVEEELDSWIKQPQAYP